jgi:hypothetical protein
MLELREKAEEVLSRYGIDTSKYYVGIPYGPKGDLCLLSMCDTVLLNFRIDIKNRLTRSSRDYLVNSIIPNILDKHKDDVLEVIDAKEKLASYPKPTTLPDNIRTSTGRGDLLAFISIPKAVTNRNRVDVELIYMPKTKKLELYKLYVDLYYDHAGDASYSTKEVMKEINKYTRNKTLLKHCAEVVAKNTLAEKYNSLRVKLTSCETI